MVLSRSSNRFVVSLISTARTRFIQLIAETEGDDKASPARSILKWFAIVVLGLLFVSIRFFLLTVFSLRCNDTAIFEIE